jgi:hypothetical protein
MEINKNNYEAFFLDYHEGNLSAEEVAALLLFVEQHPELKEEFESFENITLDDLSSVEFAGKGLLKKGISDANKDDYFIGSIENTLNDAEKAFLLSFISQQPGAALELDLYRKTISVADNSIAFKNKPALKRVAATGLTEQEHLLVSSTENILSAENKYAFEALLTTEPALQQQFKLYQQTRLVPDATIVFDNKQNLKKKSSNVIPLYYYVAAAASVILLTGIFFLFKSITSIEPVEMEATNTLSKKTTNVPPAQSLVFTSSETVASIPSKTTEKSKHGESYVIKRENGNAASVALSAAGNQAIVNFAKQDSSLLDKQKNESPVLNPETSVQELAVGKIKQPTTITSLQEPVIKVPQYASLRELAAEKIKEKLLDENTIAIQKKNGQAKKINGWDIAQIVTKGISKLSGRQIELKPNYSENGNITSYAFSAGEFKISKKL